MKPLAHFQSVWQRCDQLVSLHAFLTTNTTNVLDCTELLRAEWASRVSALDMYIHETVFQAMLETFQGNRPATSAYQAFQLSVDVASRIRTAPSQADAERIFDLFIREKLGRATYQFPEDIAEGIRLCSGVELWNEIALRRGATPQNKSDEAKQHKLKLSLIVNRRNKIVHEGDLQPAPLREPWAINRIQLAEVTTALHALATDIDAIIWPT